MFGQPSRSEATPATNTLVGGTNIEGRFGVPLHIKDVQITSDADNPTVQVRVSVQHGLLKMASTVGLSVLYGTYSGDYAIAFEGPLDTVNEALSNLTYTRNELGTDTFTAALVPAGLSYNSANGHLYEYIDGAFTWEEAKADAVTHTRSGATGYLATVTTEDESTFIAHNVAPNGTWIGASDADTEGAWKWAAGPENGTQFWSGAADGAVISGQFANWYPGNPDSEGNTDCAQVDEGLTMRIGDYSCTDSAAYVIEYGAPGNLPSVSSVSLTITTDNITRIVSTCAQLNAFGQDVNTHGDTIKLANDIDCTGVDFKTMYQGDHFYGVFDGRNHKISHLTINQPALDQVGLFGSLSEATVKNLVLDSGSVTGLSTVGGLAGHALGSTVTNVSSNLNVTAQESVAGLIAVVEIANDADQGHLSYVSSTGTITATTETAGGIVGYVAMYSPGTFTLEHCSSTGTINASTYTAGGLIGSAGVIGVGSNMIIQDCYVAGERTAAAYVAGVVALLNVAGTAGHDPTTFTVRRVYVTGTNHGSNNGGIIGSATALPNEKTIHSISNSFVVASLDGDPSVTGPVIGEYGTGPYEPSVSGVYYDQTVAEVNTCTGNDELTCTAVNTDGTDGSHFKNTTTQPPLNTWNFTTIWEATSQYPKLRAYAYMPDTTTDDDTDGVTSTVEEAAPNGGDGNGDGWVDSGQLNVTSFLNSVTSAYTTVQVPSSCTLSGISAAAESSKPTTDAGFDYPTGLVAFTANCGTAGVSITVSQYYYGLSTSTLVGRKYNSVNHSYGAISGAAVSQVTIGGESAYKVTYQVTDGGSLDEDGVANGTIVDPAGLGTVVLQAPKTGVR